MITIPPLDHSLESIVFYSGVSIFLFTWLIALIWVVRDVFKRSESFLFQVFSIILVLNLHVLGLIIYLLIRPHRTIEEQLEAHWDRELFLSSKTANFCPSCDGIIQSSYNICPWCRNALKHNCTECMQYIDLGFKWCPHCGKETASGSKKPSKSAKTKK